MKTHPATKGDYNIGKIDCYLPEVCGGTSRAYLPSTILKNNKCPSLCIMSLSVDAKENATVNVDGKMQQKCPSGGIQIYDICKPDNCYSKKIFDPVSEKSVFDVATEQKLIDNPCNDENKCLCPEGWTGKGNLNICTKPPKYPSIDLLFRLGDHMKKIDSLRIDGYDGEKKLKKASFIPENWLVEADLSDDKMTYTIARSFVLPMKKIETDGIVYIKLLGKPNNGLWNDAISLYESPLVLIKGIAVGKSAVLEIGPNPNSPDEIARREKEKLKPKPDDPKPSKPDDPTPSKPDDPTPSKPDDPKPSKPDDPKPSKPPKLSKRNKILIVVLLLLLLGVGLYFVLDEESEY